jgi:hypothetical protein
LAVSFCNQAITAQYKWSNGRHLARSEFWVSGAIQVTIEMDFMSQDT